MDKFSWMEGKRQDRHSLSAISFYIFEKHNFTHIHVVMWVYKSTQKITLLQNIAGIL